MKINKYTRHSNENIVLPAFTHQDTRPEGMHDRADEMAGILVVTSYPPRVCGIATYSHDLIKAINNKFSNSFNVMVCALESGNLNYHYPGIVKYILNTSVASGYMKLAGQINSDDSIKIVLIQHEFGFFKDQEKAFQKFLNLLSKPVVLALHTVLPHPDRMLRQKVKEMVDSSSSIIVMTRNSEKVLHDDYEVPGDKISVIAHGTHLVQHLSKEFLKSRYGLKGRKVLTTFGLLSSGKSIETTLVALPSIIETNPEVVFLIIGKTHPEVVKNEGEKYREKLESIVNTKKLNDHVKFINSYLPLPDLLEYLQLTDIYLFTTNDPNQAVSGTFVYAMSCGCPIISTPIPHAVEVLDSDTGIIFDFLNSRQLATGVKRLLNDEPLRRNISSNTLQKIVSTAWENSAVAHAMLFERISDGNISIRFNLPSIDMSHLKHMTTNTGIIQFSKINQPDIYSGYTLDDNSRALVAMCMHFSVTGDETSLCYIKLYLAFIRQCLQPGGCFLNYVDRYKLFTDQNEASNLDDSNGRALWALGYLLSLRELLPEELLSEADSIIRKTVNHIESIHSPRAMAFAIKGLFYARSYGKSQKNLGLIETLAKRLVQMYKHESGQNWDWFESYMTYANSILPEAMLIAWMVTKEDSYKDIALSTFGFLLSQTFNENGIEVISNRNWMLKGQMPGQFGEQPIDVAYTIMTLSTFYDVFGDEDYRQKMETAFNWFLGKNRLKQIVYNPCTGGCYDGMEETHVNLNQGAESTVSYLMARLTVEKYRNHETRQPSSLPFQKKRKYVKKAADARMSDKSSATPALNYSINNGPARSQ